METENGGLRETGRDGGTRRGPRLGGTRAEMERFIPRRWAVCRALRWVMGAEDGLALALPLKGTGSSGEGRDRCTVTPGDRMEATGALCGPGEEPFILTVKREMERSADGG